MKSKWNKLIDRVDDLQCTVPPHHFASMLQSSAQPVWTFDRGNILPHNSVVVWVLYCCVSAVLTVLNELKTRKEKATFSTNVLLSFSVINTTEIIQALKTFFTTGMNNAVDYIFKQIRQKEDDQNFNAERVKDFLLGHIQEMEKLNDVQKCIDYLVKIQSELSDIFRNTERGLSIKSDRVLLTLKDRIAEFFSGLSDLQPMADQNTEHNSSQSVAAQSFRQTTFITQPTTQSSTRNYQPAQQNTYTPSQPVYESNNNQPQPAQQNTYTPSPPVYESNNNQPQPAQQPTQPSPFPTQQVKKYQPVNDQQPKAYGNEQAQPGTTNTSQSTHPENRRSKTQQQTNQNQQIPATNTSQSNHTQSNAAKPSEIPNAAQKPNPGVVNHSKSSGNSDQKSGSTSQGKNGPGNTPKVYVSPEALREASRQGREEAERKRILADARQKAEVRATHQNTGNSTNPLEITQKEINERQPSPTRGQSIKQQNSKPSPHSAAVSNSTSTNPAQYPDVKKVVDTSRKGNQPQPVQPTNGPASGVVKAEKILNRIYEQTRLTNDPNKGSTSTTKPQPLPSANQISRPASPLSRPGSAQPPAAVSKAADAFKGLIKKPPAAKPPNPPPPPPPPPKPAPKPPPPPPKPAPKPPPPPPKPVSPPTRPSSAPARSSPTVARAVSNLKKKK